MRSKSKKVYLRVTGDERRMLEQVCRNYDIDSISELMRASLENLIGKSPGMVAPDRQLRRLRMRLAALSAEVDRIQPDRLTAPAEALADAYLLASRN